MKAIIYTQYGSPDVLKLADIEKPMPNDDQVLIKVQAAALNPLDWHIMRGDPYIARLTFGLFKPKETGMPGADVAGVIEAVGKHVTAFKVGDAVFGDIGRGGCAEYAVTNPKNVVLKPANVSFEEAAATPIAALTAIQGLRHGGAVKAGDKVLVNGASGGVGSYALQFAKAAGAHVTAVCSGRNADLVRSIGADAVIDYTREDFTKQPNTQYDLIFDSIGNISVFAAKRVLKKGGRFVNIGITSFAFMVFNALAGVVMTKLTGNLMGLMGTATVNSDDLHSIANHLESKRVVSLIDRRYPLSETAEAMRYLETGRARGKVMISVS